VASKRPEAPQRVPVQAAAPAASAAVSGPAVASATPPPAAAPTTESAVAPPGAPKLTITGGVYSTNAAQRLLIVGGQVFNEGSEVAPGVVLEQVRPNQALLMYQGQRYTVRY
jgi:general secretion pathway protein B